MQRETEDLDKYVDAYENSFPYAHDNHGVLTAYAEEFVRTCNQITGPLDICSLGIGYEIVSRKIGAELGPRIKSYLAVEGSQLLIERYKRENSFTFPFELVHSYFEDFDTDKRYDVIEMGFVLEHVADPAGIVERFSKFLKPGGIIAAAVPNARSMHRVLGQRAGLLDDLYKLSEWDFKLGHRRYYDSDTFRSLFTDLGLTVRRETGLMLKPFATSQMQMLNLNDDVWGVLFRAGDLAPKYAYSLFAEVTAAKT